jgi:hypothetical protein
MVAAIGLQQIDLAYYRLIPTPRKALKSSTFKGEVKPPQIFPLARGLGLGEVQRNG